MNLDEYCKTLTKKELFSLAIKVNEKALPIWDEYCSKNKLQYRDTVVAMWHVVDKELLSNAINFCRQQDIDNKHGEYQLNNLLKEFADPICAIQDFDWRLPENVKKTFYAVYNLLDGIKKPITSFNDQTHYVSINQAVDAIDSQGLLTFEQIKEILYSDTQ